MANSAPTYIATAGEGPVPQWHGVYLGYIAVNQDPTAQGRVKLRVPQVFGGVTSGWAAPAVPLTYIPKVGTAAYVMFAGGDPSQPVWFGNFALPDSASGFVFSATEPPDPTIGEVWVNTTDGLMSEWNGAGWVAYQIGGGAVQPHIGLQEPNITGGVITGAEFVGTNWIENEHGSFLYSGTPALGNMIASSAPTSTTTDGLGNAVVAGGYTSYSTTPGVSTTLFPSGLGFADTPLGIITIFNMVSGQLVVEGVGVGQSTVTFDTQLIATSGNATFPTLITTDTWHSLGTCGSTNCTLLQARYRLTTEGECEIDIALEALTGGSTAGTYTFTNTLPSVPNYQFPGNFLRNSALAFNDTITSGTENSVIAVDGSGTGNPGRVRITIPAVSANVFFTGTCRIPLN